MNPNPHLDEMVANAHRQIIRLLNGPLTPVVVNVGHGGKYARMFVANDYWPEQDDRALALGQAATWEMTVGGLIAPTERYGIVWSHIVTLKTELDFGDETSLSWRRLQDGTLQDVETEALLGFAFDIDSGFEVGVTRIAKGGDRYYVGDSHRYESDRIVEPLPGLTLMKTMAENAPVKEYT